MDIFDLKVFFAGTVSVLAAECPSLLFSCDAFSAKRLVWVRDRKSTLRGEIGEGHRRLGLSRRAPWKVGIREPGSIMIQLYHCLTGVGRRLAAAEIVVTGVYLSERYIECSKSTTSHGRL